MKQEDMNKLCGMSFDEQMKLLKESFESVPEFPEFTKFKATCDNISGYVSKSPALEINEQYWPSQWHR